MLHWDTYTLFDKISDKNCCIIISNHRVILLYSYRKVLQVNIFSQELFVKETLSVYDLNFML